MQNEGLKERIKNCFLKKPSRSTLWYWLLLSLALHYLPFLLILEPLRTSNNTISPIEVKIDSSSTPITKKQHLRSKTNKWALQKTKARGLKLKDLIVPFQLSSEKGNGKLTQGSSEGFSVQPWGSDSSDFQKIGQFDFMNEIFYEINNLLDYPSILAQNKIQGSVHSSLIITPKGQCDWKSTRIISGQVYLRVYTLDLLKKLCLKNFPRASRFEKNIQVDLSFLFTIWESNDPSIKKDQSRILGNMLMFYRNSHQSRTQWKLGPFTGMFPIPIVAIDFGWLQENWDQYINHKKPQKFF
ncbi:MAG: hypothetical protein K1X29_03770 [Bdellovibrionales bacterium]|nr:hypothetical protein [Bdellovibrionales bacterium]